MLKKKPFAAVVILVVLLLCIAVMACGIGSVQITPGQLWSIVIHKFYASGTTDHTPQQDAVFSAIRFPRVLLGMMVGASLAISGAALQGLFQNPLTEPGLVGVSSGATLGAAVIVVMGHKLPFAVTSLLGIYTLPFASFITALLVAILVYRISQYGGRTLVNTVLLAGIALNALASALTGFMIYYASDSQLRAITFWMLGSLGGATWSNISAIAPFVILSVIVLAGMGKQLNTFALGESNAAYLGTKTETIKKGVIVLTAMAVGASVAVSGVILFVGLIVPHILRMIMGPDHRYLLTASALAGASLMVAADIVARTLFDPAEIPIGIVTSLVGAPFFIYILLTERKKQLVS